MTRVQSLVQEDPTLKGKRDKKKDKKKAEKEEEEEGEKMKY